MLAAIRMGAQQEALLKRQATQLFGPAPQDFVPPPPSLISTDQVLAPLYPVCDEPDSNANAEATKCISAKFGNASIKKHDGTLQILDGVLCDTGAYRGAIGLNRLTEIMAWAAEGTVTVDWEPPGHAVNVVGSTANPIGTAHIHLYFSGYRMPLSFAILEHGRS